MNESRALPDLPNESEDVPNDFGQLPPPNQNDQDSTDNNNDQDNNWKFLQDNSISLFYISNTLYKTDHPTESP